MSKATLALVLVLALAAGFLAVQAGLGRRTIGPAAPPAHPLVELVGMTPTQTRGLADLEKQFIARRDPVRDKVLARRADLYVLLQADRPDQARIDADIQAISALQTQVQREVAAHLLRVKGILNEQQRKQFFAALAVTMCPAALGPGAVPCQQEPQREDTATPSSGH
jgi:hypothetical protein